MTKDDLSDLVARQLNDLDIPPDVRLETHARIMIHFDDFLRELSDGILRAFKTPPDADAMIEGDENVSAGRRS